MASRIVDNTVQINNTIVSFEDEFYSTSPNFCNPNELKPRYVCELCNDLLRQPMQTPCGHRACKRCIDERFGDNAVILCPMNHDDLDEEELAEEVCQFNGLHRDKVVRDTGSHRVLLKQTCFCENQPFGCCDRPPWKKLKEHQTRCIYKPVSCPNLYCPEMFAEHDIPAHLLLCRFPSPGDASGSGSAEISVRSSAYSCDTCDYTTQNHEKLTMHQKISPTCMTQAGKCYFCDFNTTSLDELKGHMEKEMACHLEETALKNSLLPKNERRLQLVESEHSKTVLDQVRRANEEKANVSRKQQNEQLQAFGFADRVHMRQPHPSEILQDLVTNGRLSLVIPGYKQKKANAILGKEHYYTSPVFYTGKIGYKMCFRVYWNGVDSGKSSFLSIYIILCKGEFDNLMSFPFKQRVTISLLSQWNPKLAKHEAFLPDESSPSFRRPMDEMNTPSGYAQFAAHSEVESKFVEADSICIRVKVEPGGDLIP